MVEFALLVAVVGVPLAVVVPKLATKLADRIGSCSTITNRHYNPTGMYGGSSRDAIAAFKHVLDRARIPATVRLTRGRDIAAACGQLAASRRPRA